MATQGPNAPSTAANIDSGDAAWSNPNNSKVEDGVTADLIFVSGGSDSDLCNTSGYGWPAGIASVSNVLVEFKVGMVGTATNIHYGSNAVASGSFASPASAAGLTWVTAYNGAASDATKIIGNTDFYYLFLSSIDGTGTYNLDAVRVTITYVASSGLPNQPGMNVMSQS